MKFTRFLSATLLCTLLALQAKAAVFIANASVTETSLSAEDLKNILLGNKTRWASGTVKLALQPEGAVHAEVIKTYTQRSTDQYDTFWKKLVFSGRGTMPAKLKTDAEVIDYVAKNPGAFGYVASAPASGEVKTLTIN